MKLSTLLLRREQDAWWADYRDALWSGVDMHKWLAEHPFPASPETAERVRSILTAA